ncbi:hypothetical protein B0H10DRAFT_1958092 [Mycena sp. CBHHK59/15]|nr:hypothetical protein B0H10DRAFT_1958092 [Mycena sp. CBHHK59/15]
MRPTEDFTQVGVLAAQRLKLKPNTIIRLEDFAKTANSASEVTMFAQLLKITEMQALISPTNVPFSIPKKLDSKINIHSIRTMLSPTLAFYVKKASRDTPSGIMKVWAWGITSEDIDDKAHWGVVSSHIRTCLTDRRYEIKKVISDSIWVSVKSEDGELIVMDRDEPLNIIQLCEALVEIVPDAGIKVTLPMLGRVALLSDSTASNFANLKRHVLIDVNGGQKFWEKVDEQLAMLREKYDNNEEALISK